MFFLNAYADGYDIPKNAYTINTTDEYILVDSVYTDTVKMQETARLVIESQSVTESAIDNNEKVFDIAEQMPSFKGNVNQWISQNLNYPAVAAENDIQGHVIVNFIVEKDGSVSNVQVTRSIDPALDREAVNLIKRMPKWNPGMNDGRPVRVKFTLPVTFKLQ